MSLHSLLEKQIKERPADFLTQPGVLDFVEAVNNSYKSYETNLNLIAPQRQAIRGMQVQKKLNEYEARFRKAFETIGDNVWELDLSSDKTYFSNTRSHFLGYTINEFKDDASLWFRNIHADDKIIFEENATRYRQGLIDHHMLEYRIMQKDGTMCWIMDRGVVLEMDPDGKPFKIIGTHTDITERKLAEELLQREEKKYRSIIANMNLGLLEVDTTEKVLFTNQSFCDMSGYDADELIGKRASLIYIKGDNIELIESKNEARKKGSSDAYEIAVKNKRGHLRWWLVSGAPRYNDSGELIGSIGIHLDITDQKQLEIDLIEAREQAEESTRAKELFLANMSHEIRTPMNAILGMSHQLAKTPLDSRQKVYLDAINSSSENLLVIINDILDLSKIEAGKLNLEKIGFVPKEVLARAMQVLVHKAEEKGLSLTNSIWDQNIAPVLMGDPFRLNQVLLNLISNAIKFTDKGGVDICCSVWNDTVNNQTILVVVKDTGIGMDGWFVKNLFEKFSQEDASVTRQYGGTGLGMSICKDLIELMEGEINVSSKKGEGTTVSFMVSLEKGSSFDLPLKENFFINKDMLVNRKILVVDDNQMNRLVASTILRNYGAIITEAVNGQEAVDQLVKQDIDLVLMDIQMPVMDGKEATGIIREKINATLPIIALTANAIKGDSDKCLAAGMNGYLAKPFKEEELLKIVSYWLADAGAISVKEGVSIKKELYNLTNIRSISRGNNDFVEKMVNMFVMQAPMQVAEMEMNFTHKNFQAMGAVAHKLKPGFDSMGIVALKETIREIEKIGRLDREDAALEGLLKKVSTHMQEVISNLRKDFNIVKATIPV